MIDESDRCVAHARVQRDTGQQHCTGLASSVLPVP